MRTSSSGLGRLGLLGSLCLGSLSLLQGCAPSGALPAEAEGSLAQHTDAIFGGHEDHTRQAVVALLSNDSLCTGTIIRVVGGAGYVITAAHCCEKGSEPLHVVQGDDFGADSAIRYKITAVQAHPSYDFSTVGSPYDFCMVKFVGASSETPVIPVMTAAQDDLAVGSELSFAGYGLLDGLVETTKRYAIEGIPIDTLDEKLIEYSQANGGPCSGDSGGPSFSLVGGKEVVSSITSFGDEKCTEVGYSGRVSAVVDSFIEPFIAGQPAVLTCEECQTGSMSGQGACVQAVKSCLGDATCSALVECLDPCKDQACIDKCAEDHADGIANYNAIGVCICEDACSAECASASYCQAQQEAQFACGIGVSEKACNTCLESECCAEAKACADDGTCPSCFGSNPPSGCSTNVAAEAFYQCIVEQCPEECGVSSSTSTSSGGSSSTSSTGGGGQGGEGAGGGSDTGSGAGEAGGSAAGSKDPNAVPTGETVSTGPSNEDGGFCSLERAPAPSTSRSKGTLLLASLFGLSWVVRRRRSRG